MDQLWGQHFGAVQRWDHVWELAYARPDRQRSAELTDTRAEEFDPKCQEHFLHHGSARSQSGQCQKEYNLTLLHCSLFSPEILILLLFFLKDILFTKLYHECREKFLVSNELTLRAQLTEFIDHKLIKFKPEINGQEAIYLMVDDKNLKMYLEDLKDKV